MGFDVAIGDLIGSLFAGAGADAGVAAAADVGAGAAVDAGVGAGAGLAAADAGAGLAGAGVDIASGIGAGAADVGAGALDTAGALDAAGAVDAGAAGAAGAGAAGAADVGAAGLGAVDAGLPADLFAGNLGTEVGGDVSNALAFAPSTTPADTAVASQAAGALPSSSGAFTTGAAVNTPSAELAGDTNIDNLLGVSQDAAQPADATTSQAAFSGATENLGGPSGVGSDAAGSAAQQAASSGNIANQIAAEGGLSQDEQIALAQAGGASAATPTSAAQPGVLDSLTSGASSVINSPITKVGELALPLGFLGYELAKGPAPLPSNATAAVNNAAAQLGPLQSKATQNTDLFNSTAATDLNLANNFQINPAQAAAITTWTNNQYNQLRQQIANQGITNVDSSSEWVQGKNQIDQQALAQQVQMINQLISTAFQASSAANAGVSTSANVTAQFDSTLMQAAQLQVQQDQNFQQAIGSALQAFGLVAALQGKSIVSGGGATAS